MSSQVATRIAAATAFAAVSAITPVSAQGESHRNFPPTSTGGAVITDDPEIHRCISTAFHKAGDHYYIMHNSGPIPFSSYLAYLPDGTHIEGEFTRDGFLGIHQDGHPADFNGPNGRTLMELEQKVRECLPVSPIGKLEPVINVAANKANFTFG